MTPELSRPVRIERIGPSGLNVEVVATAEECAALAVRLRLPAVIALTCRFNLLRAPGNTVLANGSLDARVMQTCVVSLDDFEAVIVETFAVSFVPEGSEAEDVTPEGLDEIPYDGVNVDLGEAAAEQLALALDPYPRKPDAELPEETAMPEPNAFTALARMRRH